MNRKMTNYHLIPLVLTCFMILGCQNEPDDSTAPTNTPSANQPVKPQSTDITANDNPLDNKAPKREFSFVYGGAISELTPGTEVSVWLPIATDTHEQQILDRDINVPGEFIIGQESRFGNTVLHFKATANEDGEVPFEVTYQISRHEALQADSEELSEGDAELFRQASSFVPIDQKLSAEVLGKNKLAEDLLTAGRQIYDAVNQRMQYDKPDGKPWGRGDSVWACGNGFGNCTDFHSLFISVCREQQIPARFEIGFPLPAERGTGSIGGYHCWAKFAANNKWIPVDISEADKNPTLTDYYYGNLTADRVTFTTGRDLTLTPAQQDAPVNFLVYPYAEVEGKAYSVFRKGFTYQDIQ